MNTTSLPTTPLELKIDDLIQSYHKLRLENKSLSEQIKKLHVEKSRLLAQRQEAAIQIKQLIVQLRGQIHE